MESLSLGSPCLDHVIGVNEAGLRRGARLVRDVHRRSRTHLKLAKDSPVPRPVQSPSTGRIGATPAVGGLPHRYDRVAA